MAFLLPIAEIAGLAGEVGAAATGSEALGTAVGGAVGGAVAAKANDALNSVVEGAFDKAFGQGAFANAKGKVEKAVNKATSKFVTGESYSKGRAAMIKANIDVKANSKVLGSFLNGNTPPVATPEQKQLIDQLNKQVADKWSQLSAPTIIGANTSPTPAVSDSNTAGTITPITGVKSNIGSIFDTHPSVSGISSNKTIELRGVGTNSGIGTALTQVTSDQPKSVGNSSQTLSEIVKPMSNSLPLNRDTGYQMGKFIATMNWQSTDNEDGTAGIETVVNNPEYLPVAYVYTEFINNSSLDNFTQDQIADIYNGRSINTKDAFVDANGKFSIFDELGAKQTYTGPQAPPDAGVLTLISLGFVKAIHGYWFGPKSENNHLPVDLADTYAMMHDIDYAKGWFDLEGDIKLVSRLSHNLDRMGFIEQQYAQIGIKWFSTVGRALAHVTNGIGANADKVPDNKPTQDIASFISYNANKGIPISGSQTKGPDQFYVSNSMPDPMKKMEFYAGLREGISDVQKTVYKSQGFEVSRSSDILSRIIVDNIYD